MRTLKKFFPLSFNFAKDGNKLAIGLLIYVGAWLLGPFVAGLLVGIVMAILGLVTCGLTTGLAAPIGGLVGGLVGLYCIAGIVFLILVYAKVIKVDEAVVEADEEAKEE